MGCGSSKYVGIDLQKGDIPEVSYKYNDKTSEPPAKIKSPIHDNKDLKDKIDAGATIHQSENSVNKMMQDGEDNANGEADEVESGDRPIDLTKQYKPEQKEQLKTLPLSRFLEEGRRLIKEINEMPMTLEDVSDNFQKANGLRNIYHNARYGIRPSFCMKLLNELNKDGLFPCVCNAMKRLQATWPKVFSETLNPEEEFKPAFSKLVLTNYDPSENAIACVWIKLNNTILGATDLHEESRIKAGEENTLEYYLQQLIPSLNQGGYPRSKSAREVMLQSGISFVYNCSMSTSNIGYFQQFNGVDKLLALTTTPNERLNMTSLFALAYLIDEKNNHLIMSKGETIDKMIDYLQNACRMKGRRFKGLSSLELANALTRIAVNDENKKMIGKREGLVALMKMFDGAKNEQEQVAAANAIWMLLFDSSNQEIFMGMENAFDSLKALKDCENEDLRKAITGIMWEVKMKHDHMEKMAAGGTQDENNNKSYKHVMISYNWEQQPLMLKVRDALKQQGYNVWMDVDKIGGSTLQAMALAVENSAAILVAVSRKYKESANCRSEAEYAFQLKKDIVPLMLEKNYQPDGWLGFIVGAKFWIDFTKLSDFQINTQKLTREIGERGKSVGELIKPVDAVDLGATPVTKTKTRKSEVAIWGNEDVKNWLVKNQLEKKMKASILEKLTGKRLLSLFELQSKAPEFFFNAIRTDFGFPDVLDLLDFTDALEELFT